MRSSRNAFSTVAAIRRIFIAQPEHFHFQRKPTIPATGVSRLRLASIEQRSYASPPTGKERLPRDDEITHQMIRIVSEDKKLTDPQYTSSILRSIDRQTKTLVMVALSSSDSDPHTPSYPICKIQSKQALQEAHKLRSQKKRGNPSATVKTIELNWAIDPHDLEHRLARVKSFLSKGWRVEILMAGKKRGRKATPEEAEALVKKVRNAIKEVEGSKEWKAMEGNVAAIAKLHAQGKLVEEG